MIWSVATVRSTKKRSSAPITVEGSMDMDPGSFEPVADLAGE